MNCQSSLKRCSRVRHGGLSNTGGWYHVFSNLYGVSFSFILYLHTHTHTYTDFSSDTWNRSIFRHSYRCSEGDYLILCLFFLCFFFWVFFTSCFYFYMYIYICITRVYIATSSYFYMLTRILHVCARVCHVGELLLRTHALHSHLRIKKNKQESLVRKIVLHSRKACHAPYIFFFFDSLELF